jgi:D-alanine--poly(phosphoribitol) ligase subunit 1
MSPSKTHNQATVLELIQKAVVSYPLNPALDVDGVCYSYAELWNQALRISSLIHSEENGFVGLFSQKKAETFMGLLGILQSNKTYVPFSLDVSQERFEDMVHILNLNVILCDASSYLALQKLIAPLNRKIKVISIQPFAVQGDMPVEPQKLEPFVSPAPVYVLFTSGSTGRPKAVQIDNINLASYLRHAQERYLPSCHDRFSQIIDLTFDLSAHEIFLAWVSGACLCVFGGWNVLSLAAFVREKRITFWLSVPSTALSLKQSYTWKPFDFPSLKVSLFCGEPLTQNTARFWHTIAYQSRIENIYGPTEATIAFTYYTWEPNKNPEATLVPIGKPSPTHLTKLTLESKDEILAPFQVGELWLGGPQVALGYLNNPQKTQDQFETQGEIRWYRTGDQAFYDDAGDLHYVGRKDDQWQVRGQRVEKLEIESLLKRIVESDFVAVIPHYDDSQILINGVIAFVAQTHVSLDDIYKRCQGALHSYFIPKKFIFLDSLPTNKNGKVDYGRLKEFLS